MPGAYTYVQICLVVGAEVRFIVAFRIPVKKRAD
jgi:hypothetical protein